MTILIRNILQNIIVQFIQTEFTTEDILQNNIYI